MSEIMEPTIEQPPAEKLRWFKVWTSAITQPSTETFEWILRDPQASPRRAYLWVFITSLISMIITGVYSTLGLTTGLETFEPWLIFLICVPLFALLSIFGLALNSWVNQWIAGKFFGGSGTYATMIYANAAYLAPISIISALIGAIPYVNFCIGLPLAIYNFVLGVIAIKAVNRIGWGGAVVSYFALSVLLFGVACVGTICVLILLGPAVTDVFQNIVVP